MILVDKLFKDKTGKFVITQRPNWQLTSAMTFWLISMIIKKGTLYEFSYALFLVFLTIWAYEELANGDSIFRKILGLGFSLFIIFKIVSYL